MTLALKSLHLMLAASLLSALLMVVLWLGFGDAAARPAFITQFANVMVCLFFTAMLPMRKAWISVLFVIYCGLLLIGSKMGGFTLTTLPVYVMAILSLGGLAGIARWFSKEREGRDERS